jgi:phage major head subunit gpT-like protein
MQLAANWPDLLEKDFRKVYMDQYRSIPAMVPDLYNVMRSDAAFEKTSQVGTVPDFTEFTGRIAEVSPKQGYDKTYTFTEFAAKIEIQRKLAADDQYRVMKRLPRGLATSASRSREKLGAQTWSLAFTFEPTDGDGAELCASDHGSNVAGVAPQSNEGTLSLSATAVETTRINMHAFKDDQGELISVNPDTITIPRALEQSGWEIINTKGKVDTAENNANFHQGKYKLIVWYRFSDTNNWFMSDYRMQKEFLLWWNREPIQFFQDKDSNTLTAIYLGYYRVGTGWDDWRWLFGHLV